MPKELPSLPILPSFPAHHVRTRDASQNDSPFSSSSTLRFPSDHHHNSRQDPKRLLSCGRSQVVSPSLSSQQTMGCAGSSQTKGEENSKKVQKPKAWKHNQPITMAQLQQMREEFWDTAPHYGGRKEIWDALRAAAESDLNLAQVIVDSVGVILTSADMTTCYDERGAKYELPKYVLSEPSNLIRDS